MRILPACLVSASILFASTASAQDAPAPAVAPVASVAPVAPVAPLPAFVCRAGETRGIPEADASTATFLLCRELGRAAGGRGAFEVSLRPLGQTVIATVIRTDNGDSRSTALESLSEVVVASGRLADALLQGRPLEDTRKVQTVLANEAASPRAVSGQRHIALHVIGMAPLGAGTVGAGAGVGYLYEMPRWSVGGHLDIAGQGDTGDMGGFSSVAIGSSVRRFFGDRDIAPFVGGGVSLLFLSVTTFTEQRTSYGYRLGDERSGTLLAPFVEGGFSAFRTTRGRFVTSLRVEAPLGRLEDSGWSEQAAKPKYVLPVSLRVGVQF